MLRYFEKHTYMGPNSKPQIELATEIATKDFVPFKGMVKSKQLKNKSNVS